MACEIIMCCYDRSVLYMLVLKPCKDLNALLQPSLISVLICVFLFVCLFLRDSTFSENVADLRVSSSVTSATQVLNGCRACLSRAACSGFNALITWVT